MTEQQKQAVEEDANKFYPTEIYYPDFNVVSPVYDLSKRLAFFHGAKAVLKNPSKYGLQPINEWVSVEDRLPEKHETIMILEWIEGLSEPCVLMGSFEGNRWRIYGGNTADKVTHWQSRPQPPINEREEG